MKLKDYIEKHRNIIEPINYTLSELNVLNILDVIGQEIGGGGFGERVKDFVEKEKEILMNTEIVEGEEFECDECCETKAGTPDNVNGRGIYCSDCVDNLLKGGEK